MALPIHLKSDKGESIVFEDVSWKFYEAFNDDLIDTPSRISYDGRTLEIPMTLSIEHEKFKAFLASIVDRAAEAFNVQMVCGGSATLKSSRAGKGLEADECFWIEHAAAVQTVDRLDLEIHPAPDLVIEVDVTHSTVDRESIYASIGVPEMWHFDVATRLTGWVLSGGTWQRAEFSRAFPALRVSDLNVFIDRFGRGENATTVRRELRMWLESL